MKLKKRKKRTRKNGRRTCGRGSRKKGRGKGSRGGKGMAGSGKRADQLKTLVIKKYGKNYLGKKGFSSMKKKRGKKLKEITLRTIIDKKDYFIKKGIGKSEKNIITLDLKGYKLIFKKPKPIKEKLIIKVNKTTKKAKKEAEKLGWKIEL